MANVDEVAKEIGPEFRELEMSESSNANSSDSSDFAWNKTFTFNRNYECLFKARRGLKSPNNVSVHCKVSPLYSLDPHHSPEYAEETFGHIAGVMKGLRTGITSIDGLVLKSEGSYLDGGPDVIVEGEYETVEQATNALRTLKDLVVDLLKARFTVSQVLEEGFIKYRSSP